MDKIVTLTMNPALDVGARVHSVAPEIKLRCARPQFHPGGGGINVSRAIHFLGGDSTAVFSAGGHTGAMLTQLTSGGRHSQLSRFDRRSHTREFCCLRREHHTAIPFYHAGACP